MSFFLLPPVSYQTQQKLKKHSASGSSASRRRHRQPSSASSASSVKSAPRSSRTVSTSTASGRSPPAITNPHAYTLDNPSIDEISNLDALSITSDKSPKSKSQPNYNCGAEINELLGTSKHRGRGHRRRSQGGSVKTSASAMDASSTYSHRQYQPSAYSTSVFSEDDSLVQPVANGITSNYRMEFRDKVHPVEDADANDIENSKTSVEFQLSEDEAEGGEGNQLTRVYSDVDSIFSTKVDVSPKKKGLFH